MSPFSHWFHLKSRRYILPFCLILLFLSASPVALGQSPDPSYGLNTTAERANLKTGGTLSPQQQINLLIATIIKTIIGLTGVVFMIMIVAAGDLWMTAGGNEEKITKARTMIFNAAVGILVVFGAYVATDFIVNVTIEAIGG